MSSSAAIRSSTSVVACGAGRFLLPSVSLRRRRFSALTRPNGDADALDLTCCWVREWVVKQKLCPFALPLLERRVLRVVEVREPVEDQDQACSFLAANSNTASGVCAAAASALEESKIVENDSSGSPTDAKLMSSNVLAAVFRNEVKMLLREERTSGEKAGPAPSYHGEQYDPARGGGGGAGTGSCRTTLVTVSPPSPNAVAVDDADANPLSPPHLQQLPPPLQVHQPESTLLVVPPAGNPSNDLSDFNAFTAKSWELCNILAHELNASEKLQIVLFHPLAVHNRYGGSGEGGVVDARDYTIKAPFPTFHLLREADVLAAVQSGYPQPERIPERNATRFRNKGAARLEEEWTAWSAEAGVGRRGGTC